jgi:predicted ATPase
VVDVLAFDAAISAQETAALERAVSLYRGSLLEGCEEAWAFQERRVREEAYLQALETLAERALVEGDVAASERYLRRAVATDPLRERAQRALMAALARGGNHAAAMETYRELRLLLHRELNAQPDRETTALFERIRSQARVRSEGAAAETAQEEVPARRPFPRAAAPGNLPSPLTSFIGREREIADVRRCLATTRLTLTGPGGCGKTRLALESAGTLADRFPDGVWLVELAALTDPARVPDTVAYALGLSPAPLATPILAGEDRPAYSRLIDALRPRVLLLLLDNCEHLAEACARLAESLLRACPELRVLATSREPLGVTGETARRVPSLSLPPVGALLVGALSDGRGHPPGVPLLQYEAVQLFVDRATVAQPAFCLTEQNASAVVQVCRRLDGIPLAIELAAVRVRALPVEKIAERLDDRFRLLTGGSRSALPRQQTLRALIDWSYDLLSEPERVLLCRLSVFRGGWTLEAAEAVCPGGAIEAGDLLDLLTALVEKSLVLYEAPEDRYQLLETVRQYGHDRLREAGEEGHVRGRHRDWFLKLVQRAEPELKGPQQGEWLDALEAEHDNMRAALVGWWESGDVESALAMGGALGLFWYARGYWSEGRERLEELLNAARSMPAPPSAAIRSKALGAASVLALNQGDIAGACVLCEESVALARGQSDRSFLPQAIMNLGEAKRASGDFAAAQCLFEESLALSRELGDRWHLRWSLLWLGHIHYLRGDADRARPLIEESLALWRELGRNWGGAYALAILGDLAYSQGDHGSARTHCEEALELLRSLGNKAGLVWPLRSLAHLARREGDSETARSRVEESLAVGHALADKRIIGVSLADLGRVEVDQGHLEAARAVIADSLRLLREIDNTRDIADTLAARASLAAARQGPWRAARLLGAAEGIHERIGAHPWSFGRPDREHDVAAARAALGETAFAAAWAEGRAMTMDETVAYVLNEEEAPR